MEHYSLSKAAVTRAPAPHTCQADLSLQGFWGGESTLVPFLLTQSLGSVHGLTGPSLQCAGRGRNKEGTQQSCAIGQGQPAPAPPPSLSTGLKIDVIRFQKGKERERSSVMTLDMLWGCFSPRVAGPRWAPRWRFRTRSSRGARPGHGHQLRPLATGFFLFIPPHPPSCCLQPAPSLPGEKHQWAPRAPSLSPCCSHLTGPTPLNRGTCRSHTDFGVLEPHSVPGGCREAPRAFLS